MGDLNFFIVSTPLQYIFAESAVHDFELTSDNVALIHIETSCQTTNIQTRNLIKRNFWRQIYTIDDYPPHGQFRFEPNSIFHFRKQRALREFAKTVHSVCSQNLSVETIERVFIGDLREGLQVHMAHSLKPNFYFLLDDGSITPTIALERLNRWRTKGTTIESAGSANLRKLAKETGVALKTYEPETLTFYSIYELSLAANDTRIEPQFLKRTATKNVNVLENVGWVVGSNHVEGGICSLESYSDWLETICANYKTLRLSYLPHRREDRRKAKALCRQFDLELVDSGVPLEVYILSEMKRPELLIGSASTVLDSVNWLFEGKQRIDCYTLPVSYFSGKRMEHILKVQAYHLRHANDSFRVFQI